MSRFRCPGCGALIKGKGVARLCHKCSAERTRRVDELLETLERPGEGAAH